MPADIAKRERDRRHDAKRRGSLARALYASTRWKKERAEFLQANPWCALHLTKGERVPAGHVDHVERHDGDPAIFWDRRKWQSLCKGCHNRWKQRAERSRFAPVGLNGWPTKQEVEKGMLRCDLTIMAGDGDTAPICPDLSEGTCLRPRRG